MTRIVRSYRMHFLAWNLLLFAVGGLGVGLVLLLPEPSATAGEVLDFKATDGYFAARFLETGDLILRGSLYTEQYDEETEESTISDSASYYEYLVDDSVEIMAKIVIENVSSGAANGNMYIYGWLNENQDMPLETDSAVFVARNPSGQAVAMIDDMGDLYLCGSLYEGVTTSDPFQPKNLTATRNQRLGVSAELYETTLTWLDLSTGETNFCIERKALGGSYSQIDTTSANVETYSDTTAAANTVYYYQVRAYDGTSYSDYSDEVCLAALNMAACESP